MKIKTYDPSSNLINFEDTAQTYLLDSVLAKGALGVKLSLMPGGCSGFEFKWDYIYEYYDGDDITVQQEEGFVFIVDNMSVGMLAGSTVVLEDNGLAGQQLLVKSPNSTGACGCGESIAF